ncbi:MAG: cell surface protein SprA [Ignavibacteria bacterium RIFCSPLOWO2_12_FULL_56_21]|nr:MAG: cell surface protein SprA [Ignavibacteria bacterium GWC2_56_12]OGU67825.1 MAG: cell surface protein SprA [Ignavibacteria bacterium RIFCSPHIGHO2_02_FULL_56_12]OGU76648.1 MAG: cell surface protein SprA [Ignavibacteria bacterium RIFCSPLOWO2_12_FULL_56_21]HAV22701.1 cell surface protein SprA [Bacteroidota bacterium]
MTIAFLALAGIVAEAPGDVVLSPFGASAQQVVSARTDTVPGRPATSGVMNRRRRALQLRSTRMQDQVAPDTLGVRRADTTAAVPRDSSARLEQFSNERRDAVNAMGALRPPHPLYLGNPIQTRTQTVLDSTRMAYTVRYMIGTHDIRAPIILPFEEYTKVRLDFALRKNWQDMVQSTVSLGIRKEGLGELFGKVTNIEIPVPKNPIFSIFGPNIIRLQINGAVDIHAAFRNTSNDQFTNSPLGQSRNEPDFNQEVQVTLKGEIGDKLKISADWNTQRTFEYENQLKVKYTGYEDEIVQSVEAGNVSLPTSSSFIPPSQALFGILAKFQFGPLRLTTVASQKKGQIKDLTITGGAQPTPFIRRPSEYSQDHYFVDTVYIGEYENIFLSIPSVARTELEIREIEVWVTSTASFNAGDRNIIAFMSEDSVLANMNDPAARSRTYNEIPGALVVGKFKQLTEKTDFTYNPNAGIITLNTSLSAEQAMVVAYTRQGSGTPVQIGNFASRDSSQFLVMKLVKPKFKPSPDHKEAWRLLLKNRYSLGGRGIKERGFDFKVQYELSGSPPVVNVLPENVTLLEMFGLDRYGSDKQKGQDEVFDYIPFYTVDEQRGEVIFPTLEPFRAESIRRQLEASGLSPAAATAAADSFAIDAVYDTTVNGAMNDEKSGRFSFVGNVTPSTRSSYPLGYNIVDGSVEVIVDGQKATPNVDYTVDYITGNVVIKNQSLLVPGRTLQIRYEANDLFQLASKSLLGARGEFDLARNTSLGFTVMNLNQQSLSDKVRLGEEPISNTIFGMDGGTQFDLPFVTKALNWLPGVQTIAGSSVNVRGEAAYMSPDPNTRKSPIDQDGGMGIAYIDDFEGAKRSIPLGIAALAWRDISPPYYIPGLDQYVPPVGSDSSIATNDPAVESQLLPDSVKMEYKGQAAWFNIGQSDVFVQDIWGNRRSVSRQNEQVTVMNILFRPWERGTYNYSMDLENKLRREPSKAWGGIQRILGTTATNLVDENIAFVEMWVNVTETPAGGMMHINLGSISEDMIPNRDLNTEDFEGGIANNSLNQSIEDVGIDARNDAQERVDHADFVAKYPQFDGDPAGDNWRRISTVLEHVLDTTEAIRFIGYNGTENNHEDLVGARYPDTEDLNANNNIDRVNSYFEYDIALDTTHPDFQKYVVGQGLNGWYQVRVPLNKYRRRIGSPSFSNIEAVRVWLNGAETDVLVRMTEFNLIGNQWEELVKNDPTFKVSTVNYEDNPSYTIPPGVRRERDRTRPDENILGNEQSLNLILTGVPDGEHRRAIKRFASRPLDLFSYRAMKMFVHGETRPGLTFVYNDTSSYDAEVFVRFGADSLNYYEYRAPVHPDWNTANDITIRFSDLTAIKLARDSARAITRRFPVPGGPPGSTYQIRGEPTLNRVKEILVGVENRAGGRPFLDGEVWVNELRLTDVDDTPGWAYRFDTQFKFADIASLAFSMQNRDPFFHGLEERFGSRVQRSDWTLSASVQLEKFLPEKWTGTQLSFSYSHVEALQDPRYLPGTDILVEEAAHQIDRDTSTTRVKPAVSGAALRTQSQDLSVTESYAMPAIRLNIPSTAWWVTETINRMTFGFSFTENTRRSPTIRTAMSWAWNARFGYQLPFSPNSFLEPFSLAGDFALLSPWKGTKVYYLPRQVTLSSSFNRGQSRSQARAQTQLSPVNRQFGAQRDMSFSWQLIENGLLSPSLDYQLTVASSLVHLETDRFGLQRSFSEMFNDIFLSDRLVNFGEDLQYSQSVNVATKPIVPKVLSLDKIFVPSLRYNVRYSWMRNLQAGRLGRNASWSSALTFGFDVNVKVLGDMIWSTQTAPAPGDSAAKRSPLQALDQITRIFFKMTIFDFERLNITFTQSNSSANSGVLGRPGFGNVFNRIPFLQSSLVDNGPSLLYQLGLSSDPHGEVVLGTSGSFPFIRGTTNRGPRASGPGLANLTDVFSQANKVAMRTSRPLWEGAQVDLSWNVGWSYNTSTSITVDSLGVSKINSRSMSGDVDRSFLSLPPVLFFKLFKTSIEDVNKRFERLRIDRSDGRPDEAKIAAAFEEGLEAFPVLSRLLGTIAPRVNWSIRWDGLEKMALFKSFASRVALDHSYSSNFRRRWRMSLQGEEVTEGETVSYAFTPLAGLNIGFKDFIKGNLGATIRYSTSTSFDLNPTIQNVVESGTEELSISGSYSRQGFEFPLFGLSLSNDLQMTFSYSQSSNKRKLFNLRENFKKEGTTLDGSTRTTIEPRIRYILSARVTASLYYRHTKTKPDAGGSQVIGQTINEGGLDINVAIQ